MLQELGGAVRIVAGAGTGKTAVLVDRFTRLVAAGVDPASILLLTFTERAAAEMRNRVLAATGLPLVNVSTFHAVAYAWLREQAAAARVPFGFRIVTGADRWILLRELMWELAAPVFVGADRPDDMVAPLLKMLERTKQELIAADRLKRWALARGDPGQREYFAAAADLFLAYDARCRELRLLDFDELLLRCVRLLENDDNVRAAYAARFSWLMVDEYQDTNLAQERLVELLGAATGRVCVVGDDDQSIYRFRGASLGGMERFGRAFPGALTPTLGRNRRSSPEIVHAARALIEHNRERIAKQLTSAASSGGRVALHRFDDGLAEAGWIAREIRRHRRAGGRLDQVAVLTRTHAISAAVREQLAASGIPYIAWGGHGFYDSPEVRDVIAYLRLLADPDDEVSLARVLQRPESGCTLTEAAEIIADARSSTRPLLRTVTEHPPLRDWAQRVDALLPLPTRLGVNDLFFALMEATGFLEQQSPGRPHDQARAVANVTRFGELVDEYCERSPDHSLGAFLRYLDLVLASGQDEDPPRANGDQDAVQVMTIHQAKGLEFDTVFVPGLVEGRLPQPARSDRFELPAELADVSGGRREDHLAEERRLCYVAMTRARRTLHLSAAQTYEGARRWRESRFLEEIRAGAPGAVVERVHRRRAAGATAKQRVSAGPAAAEVGAVALSFSAVSAYRECPRQYWFKYDQGLRARPSAEAEFGTLLHLVLRRLGERVQAGLPATPLAVTQLLDTMWRAECFSDSRVAAAFRRLAERLLLGYVADGGFRRAPHAVELAFTTTLDGWTLHGIIDRIDSPPPSQRGGEVGCLEKRERGAWRLVDYKTGSSLPASRLRRDLQLALYGLAARRSLGLDPVELEIVYLKDRKRVLLAADAELLAAAEAAGAEVARAVQRREFDPRPDRRRCRACPYRLACTAAL